MQNKQIKHFFFLVSICITLFICMYYGLPIIRNLILPVSRVYVNGLGNSNEGRWWEKVQYLNGDYYFRDRELVYKNNFELVDTDACEIEFNTANSNRSCLPAIYFYKIVNQTQEKGELKYQFSVRGYTVKLYDFKVEVLNDSNEIIESTVFVSKGNWEDNNSDDFPIFLENKQYLFYKDSIIADYDQMYGKNYLYKVDLVTNQIIKVVLNQSDAAVWLKLHDNSIIALVNDFEVVPKGHKDRLKHLLSSILYRIDSDTLEKEILYQAKDKQIIVGYHNHFVYVLEHKTIHKINVDTKETVKSYRLQVGMDLYICAIKDKLFIYDIDGLRLIIDYQDE